jgi:sulfur relay (sulfurtransferase) complex TusBCD TusD component (DsrE family)
MCSCKRCAVTRGILSGAARRTEVRRRTLKRAPQ